MFDRNRKIALNVIALFFRMLATLFIMLFSVRLLYKVLGAESYGVYTVVAGVITVFSFLSQSMSISIQRFLSFNIGKGDTQKLQKIFSIGFLIFFGVGLTIILFGETVGLYLLNHKLVIPDHLREESFWLFQFSILSFVFIIMKVPYVGVLLAYENMKVYSILNVFESLMKLGAVCLLFYIEDNLLYYYGLMLFLVALISYLNYTFFTRRLHDISKFKFLFDKKLFKSIMSFSGWSFFGLIAGIANNQGNNILINMFFGPIVNASRDIAVQVQNAVLSVSNSVYLAFKPQIIKSYAEKNFEYLSSLYYLSNKFIFIINLLITVPLIIQTPSVLEIWLGETTEQMILFTRLGLVYVFIFALNNPITIIIQATGYMKKYSLYVEGVILMSLPLTYLLFSLDFPAYTTFLVSISLFVLAHGVRLIILSNQVNIFTVSGYIKEFLARGIAVIFLLALLFYFSKFLPKLEFGLRVNFLVTSFIIVMVVMALSYLVLFNAKEKSSIKSFAMKILKR